MSFPKYPEYKDSGVEWLGEVPAHWEVTPVRAFVEERTSKNASGDEENYLSLMSNVGVIPYAEKGDVGNKKPDDLSKCKKVDIGDLVINSMNYGIGSYGLSGLKGVCSPVYIVLRPVEEKVLPRYALRIFENKEFQKLAQSFGQGILAHRSSIGWGDLKNIKVPMPGTTEQAQLSAFLDHETARIDALVEEQQRLIELLEEKRQAVISHAVTKGLDPDVPMTDSGMEWLGEVPAHWKILPLSRTLEAIEQGWSPNASNTPAAPNEWGVVKLSSIKKGSFKEDENKALLPGADPDPSLEIKNGDLLVTRANTPELVGDACIAKKRHQSRLILSDLVYRLTLRESAKTRFVCWFLISDFGRSQIAADARGSSMSMAKVSQSHIRSWLLPLPPATEQQEIADYVSKELGDINQLVQASEEALKLLSERRSALISAAVTGKIDVRGWQPPAGSSVTADSTQTEMV
ncbi:restriction endonuclease subunit S [Halomonas ramblicola]|uniref:restriction endonuclease subunit S n=1 Tax=Halomonas ramblicola TaxID=747349 RepID=UPI0025B3CCF1|nr:restriction endonuclease subunit S [Halomonas ramblicola]MDN3523331.1 restriction endonuclease subunit S [Halomonas ramblicola]